MLGAVAQQVTDDCLVRESQGVVEVLHGVLWIAAGMGAAEHGKRTLCAEAVAQGIGQLRRLGEGADEDEVDIGGQLLNQILKPV